MTDATAHVIDPHKYSEKSGSFIIADGTVLEQYVGNAEQTEVPEGIERIEDNAFCRCEKLRSVTLPASVKSIGSRAFADCPSLTFVYINSLFLPDFAKDAFDASPVRYIMTAEGINHRGEIIHE